MSQASPEYQSEGNQHAALLVHAIATTQHEVSAFARALERRADVRAVAREFDCFGHSDEFPDGPKGIVSWWVEAEYKNGDTRLYELSVFYDHSRWFVEASITEPGRDGPEPVIVFPDRTAPNAPECIRELEAALGELRARAVQERERASAMRPQN